MRPTALRGIGYSLIELGELEAARQAFEKSLKMEPNNRLALDELEYIRKLQQKNKRGD